MKVNICILDDDVQFTGMLKRIAESFNYVVQVFNDAGLFLDDVPETGVLILDLKMPGLDGIEVINRLAKAQSRLQLILMSGYDDDVLNSASTLAKAHNLTVLGKFTKPVNIHVLKQALDTATVYSDTESPATRSEVKINKDAVQKALDEEQFFLEYQPQYSFIKKRIVGFEALVRWLHPDYGVVYPDAFIPIAEKNALISALTRNVITMAFKQLAVWQKPGKDWDISINISSKDLLNMDLPAFLADCEAAYQIDPRHVMLELTESAATGSLTDALEMLNRLRLNGYRLSVDDFGTGYSSLSKLHDAPFNELKIDRCFISSMLRDERSMAIVKTCTTLARMLRLQVVAEGVEDEATQAVLQEMGCDLVQGYYIGKPMAAAKIERECRYVS